MLSFPWWTPVPWLIALLGLMIAIMAYRRTRYPSLHMSVHCPGYFQSSGESHFHAHLYVDLLSGGADIYDLCVRLECVEIIWVRKYRSRWIPRLPMRIQHAYDLAPSTGHFAAEPSSTQPNPLKSGQSVRFLMTDHHLRSTGLAYPYFRLPSEYWPGRVRLAVYHSGGRLLKKRSAWRFRSDLRAFDIGTLEAVGRRPRPVAVHSSEGHDNGNAGEPVEWKELNLDDVRFLHPELNVPQSASGSYRPEVEGRDDADGDV